MASEYISEELFYLFLEEDIHNKDLFFDPDTPPAITVDPKKVYPKKEKQHELQLLRLESKHAYEWSKFRDDFAEKNKLATNALETHSYSVEETTSLELYLPDIKDVITCASQNQGDTGISQPFESISSVDTADNSATTVDDTSSIQTDKSEGKKDQEREKKKREKIELHEEDKFRMRKYMSEFDQLMKKQRAEVKMVLHYQMAELKDLLPEEYQKRKLNSLPAHLQELLRSDANERTLASFSKRPLIDEHDDRDSKRKKILNLKELAELDTNEKRDIAKEADHGHPNKDATADKKSKESLLLSDSSERNTSLSRRSDHQNSSVSSSSDDQRRRLPLDSDDEKPHLLIADKQKKKKKKKKKLNMVPVTQTSNIKPPSNYTHKPATSSPLATSTFTRIETPTSSSQQPLFFNHAHATATHRNQSSVNRAPVNSLLGPNSTLIIRKKPQRAVVIRRADGSEELCGDPVDYNDAIIGIRRDNNPVTQRLMDGQKYLFYRNSQGRLLTVGTTAQIQPYIKKYFLSQ